MSVLYKNVISHILLETSCIWGILWFVDTVIWKETLRMENYFLSQSLGLYICALNFFVYIFYISCKTFFFFQYWRSKSGALHYWDISLGVFFFFFWEKIFLCCPGRTQTCDFFASGFLSARFSSMENRSQKKKMLMCYNI